MLFFHAMPEISICGRFKKVHFCETSGKLHCFASLYTRRGLPLGSGAVESAIRRVINLRLKGNGMFWTEENAESMLQIRCQLLGTEWDVVLDELYHHRLKTRRRKWQPCEEPTENDL